jgi:hypothetical protein
MTETVTDVTTSTQQENAAIPSLEPSLKAQLDASFASTPEEFHQILNGEQQPEPQGDQSQSQPATPQAEQPVAFDELKYVKENFGFESVEQAKAALQEYQALKAAPQTKAEIAFANEQSKKIYEALLTGETKVVKDYLELQHATANMESMSPEQQIKLQMKHQYPTLSQQMIDRQYNKVYAVKDVSEYDDPIDHEIEKEITQQKIINDAAAARTFFSEYKNKIELPQLQPIQPHVDEDYAAWKAQSQKEQEAYNNTVVPTINAIKESDLAEAFQINDQNNQMNFGVNMAYDAASVEKARQYALNFAGYINDNFYDAAGNLNGKNVMQFILRNMLFDKFAQTTASQAVNAERKRLIEKETPTITGQRGDSTTTVEKTELQKEMDRAFAGF